MEPAAGWSVGEASPSIIFPAVLLTLSGQRLNPETERWPSVTGAEMALVLAQGGVSAGAMTHHLSTWSVLERSNAPERAVTAQQRYVLGSKYYRSLGQSAGILAGYFGYPRPRRRSATASPSPSPPPTTQPSTPSASGSRWTAVTFP